MWRFNERARVFRELPKLNTVFAIFAFPRVSFREQTASETPANWESIAKVKCAIDVCVSLVKESPRSDYSQ